MTLNINKLVTEIVTEHVAKQELMVELQEKIENNGFEKTELDIIELCKTENTYNLTILLKALQDLAFFAIEDKTEAKILDLTFMIEGTLHDRGE